jgi:hypothetical protein
VAPLPPEKLPLLLREHRSRRKRLTIEQPTPAIVYGTDPPDLLRSPLEQTLILRIYPSHLFAAIRFRFRLTGLRSLTRRASGHILRTRRPRNIAWFALLFVLSLSVFQAKAEELVFKIPPVKIPLEIKDQSVTITTSTTLTIFSRDHGPTTLDLKLAGDLSDLQQNMTAFLADQLDKDDRCGERIAIENAALIPADPAGIVQIQLHFERWECVKLLGRKVSKKLIGGDARIELKLTPEVDPGGSGLRLIPEIVTIRADGSLGQLLRTGPLGDMVRHKIQDAMSSALQKGTNLGATLPPALQDSVSVKGAEFKDAGQGHILVTLEGEAHITQEQLRLVSDQVHARLMSH